MGRFHVERHTGAGSYLKVQPIDKNGSCVTWTKVQDMTEIDKILLLQNVQSFFLFCKTARLSLQDFLAI